MAPSSRPTVRLADASEIPALAQLWDRSARAGFGPLLPEGFAWPAADGSRIAEAVAGLDTQVLVGDVGDTIAGYATLGPARDDDLDSETGELRALFVDPGHWGSPVAGMLVGEGRRWLARQGYVDVILWSFVANARANAFYERLGFVPEGRREALVEFAGLDGWRLIRAAPATAPAAATSAD